MSTRPGVRDDTAPADTGRNRGAPRDMVDVHVDPSPPVLTPAAARALLAIVLAAGQSPQSVTPQRDNHPDGAEA